jgi:hypothetical protein
LHTVVKGPGGVSEAAAKTVVGKTTFSEIQGRLGKPAIVESSSTRFVANWTSVAGKRDAARLLLGHPAGIGLVVGEMLGVECNSSDVVLRKLFYQHDEEPRGPRDRFVLGLNPSKIPEIERSPKPETQEAFIQRLGPPSLKLMTLRGEFWAWYSIEGTHIQNCIKVYFDKSGRLISRNVDAEVPLRVVPVVI